MWKDPVVKKTRELREEYASQFNHNADAIFDDIRKRQEKSDRKRVAFQPKRAVTKQT